VNRLTAAFNAANGELRWQHEMLPDDVDVLQFPRLAVSGTTVYMPTQAGSILALDASTGTKKWERAFQGLTVRQWDEIAKKDVESRWNDSFLLAASTDVLYVAGEATGIVRGLRLSDGTQLWHRCVTNISGITPVMSGLLVLSTPMDGQSRAKGPTRLEEWR
jgi:outer membrane protein assembly factor BamB